MIALWSRTKEFFSTKERSLGASVISGALGGALVVVLSTVTDWWWFKETRDYRQDEIRQVQLARKMQEIRSQSIDVQTYAGLYATAVLERTEDVDVHRRTLRSALVTQFAVLETYLGVLDGGARASVEKYREELLAMEGILRSSHDVLSLVGFWEAMSDLLVARNEMLEELDRQERGSEASG